MAADRFIYLVFCVDTGAFADHFIACFVWFVSITITKVFSLIFAGKNNNLFQFSLYFIFIGGMLVHHISTRLIVQGIVLYFFFFI